MSLSGSGHIDDLGAMKKLGKYDAKSDMYIRSLSVRGVELYLYEDPSEASIHGEFYITEAACVLARFLCNQDYFPGDVLQGKRAIELGSGPGLLGLAVGVHGCNVVLTDRKLMLGLIDRNLQKNKQVHTMLQNVSCAELNWGQGEEAPFSPPVDYIFASDVTYNPDTYQDFIKTARELSGEQTQFFLSHERRWKNDPSREKLFFTLMSKDFVVEKIPETAMEAGFRSDVIDVYRFTLKPQRS